MKKIIYLLILILCTVTSCAQFVGPYTPMTGKAYQFKYVKIDSGLHVLKPTFFDDSVLFKGYTRLNFTPAAKDSSVRVANTKYVDQAVAAALGGGGGTNIYNSDGNISVERTVTIDNTQQIIFDGPGAFHIGKNTPTADFTGTSSLFDFISSGGFNIVATDDINLTADTTDIIGELQFTDGSQGNGKVLTSDANGVASWATPASGVTTMAAIGSSPNANGATISGSTLTLQPASGSFGGVVTTGTQTFAGDKTYTGAVTVTSLVAGSGGTASIDGAGNIMGANLFSGTYTPTITNGTNVQSSTAYDLNYSRVGNRVTISGKIDINPTAGATSTDLTFTLPIASDLSVEENAGGAGFSTTTVSGIAIYAEATLDELKIEFLSVGTASTTYYFTVGYQIL